MLKGKIVTSVYAVAAFIIFNAGAAFAADGNPAATVPEPSTMQLLALGLGGLGGYVLFLRKRK